MKAESEYGSESAPWPAGSTPAPPFDEAPAGAGADAPLLGGVGFTLSSVGYAVARRFRETLAPLSLEPREFALLRAVSAAEGQTQQAIGDRLAIPASRMVAFVDALEARGLVERRAQPADRRARALHLTPAGRALQRKAFAVAAAFEQDLASGLQDGERERLLERAFALAGALERHLCAQLAEQEREQLLDLLQRVGAQLGLSAGAHAAHVHSALGEQAPCAAADRGAEID